MTITSGRIAVTGGSGFIGTHLVPTLASRGYEVAVIDVVPPQHTDFASYHAADVTNAESLADAFSGTDAVIHLASSTLVRGGERRPHRDLKQGILGVDAVLDAVRRTGVKRLIYASSAHVYGAHGTTLLDEDTAPRPASLYGASKVAGEALITANANLFGLEAVILRFSIVLGPGLRRGVVYDLLAKAMTGGELAVLGDGQQVKSFVDIKDAVSAILTLGMDRSSPQWPAVYNIAGNGAVSIIEIARSILSYLGQPERTIQTQDSATGWSGDVPVVRLSTTRACNAGWQPEYDARSTVQRAIRVLHNELNQRRDATS